MGIWKNIRQNVGEMIMFSDTFRETTYKQVSEGRRDPMSNNVFSVITEKTLGRTTSDNIRKSIGLETVKFDKEPEYGALVYCELGFGTADHSGIYVGAQQIVHLQGNGKIREVGLNTFTNHISTLRKSIWYPCDADTGRAIGFSEAGSRAINKCGDSRSYNLLLDNCHQFSSGCLTNEFENADNYTWTSKHTLEALYDGKVVWREWKWY